jgi:hypothetical protein
MARGYGRGIAAASAIKGQIMATGISTSLADEGSALARIAFGSELCPDHPGRAAGVSFVGEADGCGVQFGLFVLLLFVEGDVVSGVAVPDGG